MSTPQAIAMWDFSWLERRYDGGGYEDWAASLHGLRERGYDAVRIDCYPHLVGLQPDRSWTLRPCWTEHDWGAPFQVEVDPRRGLVEFMSLCDEAGLRVTLSSWFREDVDDTRLMLRDPARFADAWLSTLQHIEDHALLHLVDYVDLINEFPLPVFAPFAHPEGPLPEFADVRRGDPFCASWAERALAPVRAARPDLPYTYSFASELTSDEGVEQLDFLELHIWMTSDGASDFYEVIGYELDTSSEGDAGRGDTVLRERAAQEYRSRPEHWQAGLANLIEAAADLSRRTGLPLSTTEGWAIVSWKDRPGMDWSWVKELTAFGVDRALATGRWFSVCTSNFCAPQFPGMWDDVAWHRALTDRIHAAAGPAWPTGRSTAS